MMTTHPAFDPELAELLPHIDGQVPVGMTPERIGHFRSMPMPGIDDIIAGRPVVSIDHRIPGYNGDEITVSVISRVDHTTPGIGFFGIHGGGMVMCDRFASAASLVEWALKYDAVCVTVEHRLAPEFRAPVPVEDCYAALDWMATNAADLAVDPERVVIVGGSGGGGLAAGTTLLARDRGGPKLAGQLLQCPMLDDRNETPSSREFDGVGVWDRTSNLTAWSAILGERRGADDVSPYSVPARATDLSRLPPTYIDAGAAEVFRDEDVAYASAIWAAGGDCELHIWGGAFHGFYDIARNSDLARSCIAAREAWLERLIKRLRR